MNGPPDTIRYPTLSEAFRFWLKLGFISFGGPAGQIAIMHREIVEQRRWVGETQFLHALNFCMLLPGPEAQQLATYLGWLLHRTLGGLIAGVLFVLPSALILWMLSYLYAAYQHVAWLNHVFYGLKPAVIGIVFAALVRIGTKALRSPVMWCIALIAFAALFLLHAPFPLVLLAAAGLGLIGGRFWTKSFHVASPHHPEGESFRLPECATSPPKLARTLSVIGICLALWWLPVLGIGVCLGWNTIHFHEGIFFSKASLLTFGGAYAVLPYVAQQAIEPPHNWLSASQMIDGLGLAETTPGPLIMVLQFVGFIAAWNHPGSLNPLSSATLGAAITTWVTFVPCFLWIFAFAPFVERLRNNTLFSSALTAVTAAVVGVILNLGVWFSLRVLFPQSMQPDWTAVIIALFAFITLHRYKWGVVTVLAFAASAGVLARGIAA